MSWTSYKNLSYHKKVVVFFHFNLAALYEKLLLSLFYKNNLPAVIKKKKSNSINFVLKQLVSVSATTGAEFLSAFPSL